MAKPEAGISGKVLGTARWLVQQCAGLAAFAFYFIVTAMAMAQQNPFDPDAGGGSGRFKAAPKPPDAEDAAAASQGLDQIMGVHINTLFFVVAGLIAVYWFTMGGGRKPKVSRDSS